MLTNRRIEKKTVTILSGASLSDAVYIGDHMVAEIQMPDAWTAADLTFATSDAEDGTYQAKYDSDNTELSVATAASRNIGFTSAEADVISSSLWLKIRSGTAGVPVNQGADRTITLILK